MSTDGNGAMTNAELDEEVETRDAEAEIEALAGLREVAYQRKRKQAATNLEIPIVTLDKLVAKRRAKLEADAEAAPLYEHWNTEPNDVPEHGGVLLQAIDRADSAPCCDDSRPSYRGPRSGFC